METFLKIFCLIISSISDEGSQCTKNKNFHSLENSDRLPQDESTYLSSFSDIPFGLPSRCVYAL